MHIFARIGSEFVYMDEVEKGTTFGSDYVWMRRGLPLIKKLIQIKPLVTGFPSGRNR